MQNIFSYFILDFWVEIWHVFTMIHLYFEVSTIAGSLTCSLYLKVIAAAYSWPTSGSTGPWIALLASQSLPSSTEILVCNVIRQFFFVPPVWQWHTVQWFSGVCILSTHSCRKNTCCSESWDNYSDLETILRSLKVYSSVFPPPTHTCHADLRSGAVISQPKWTGASWEDNRSFLSPFHLIVWDFKDLLAGGSENAFSLTSNMVCVCVGVCVCVWEDVCSYFYFPLQCSVSPHTHGSICLACVMHFSNVSSETSLVFFPFSLWRWKQLRMQAPLLYPLPACRLGLLPRWANHVEPAQPPLLR